MYCKFFERACIEPMGEIQFEKNYMKKGGGEQGLPRTLGWSSDFPEVFGEPLGYIRTSAGSIQDPLRVLKKKFSAGSAKNPSNVLKVFLSGV